MKGIGLWTFDSVLIGKVSPVSITGDWIIYGVHGDHSDES